MVSSWLADLLRGLEWLHSTAKTTSKLKNKQKSFNIDSTHMVTQRMVKGLNYYLYRDMLTADSNDFSLFLESTFY